MDAYQLPDAKGYTSMIRYLTGDTDESRQRRREEILSSTVADFKSFGEALIKASREGHVVVLGSEEAIENANAARPGWLEVRKVQ
jgi:Zn-dependent M16 (insulinase) family peptidase